MIQRSRPILLLLSILLLGCQAQEISANCERLAADIKLSSVTVEVQSIPAGQFQAPDGQSYLVPSFCRLQGIAKPTRNSSINFEVWLPQKKWNGRYYQHGLGGESGRISYADLAGSLREGNAVATSDDGHITTPASNNFRWAINHPDRVLDWGYRALKQTRDTAHAIINTYYGREPHHAYFAGCSGGGRHGLMAVQRYPEDWDGVLVVAPNTYLIHDLASILARGQLWKNNPAGRIPISKLPLIQKTALNACSANAKVVNGIAGDPRLCRYDPAILSCKDVVTDNCLTRPQIDTLRKIYDGLRQPDGTLIHPGFAPTLEVDHGWEQWMPVTTAESDTEQQVPPLFAYAEDFFRNIIFFDEPQLDIQALKTSKLVARVNNKTIEGEVLTTALNPDNPDLSKYKKTGGKLLMYFGWGDAAIPAEGGIKYYDSVVNTLGGISQTQDFYRLFMVPGMGHCVGGAGANAFGQGHWPSLPAALQNDSRHNIMRALEAWVERDVAPQKIIATKYVNDDANKGVAFTRPLCPYPQIAIYKGTGDTKEATNFVCKTGAAP